MCQVHGNLIMFYKQEREAASQKLTIFTAEGKVVDKEAVYCYQSPAGSPSC